MSYNGGLGADLLLSLDDYTGCSLNSVSLLAVTGCSVAHKFLLGV